MRPVSSAFSLQSLCRLTDPQMLVTEEVLEYFPYARYCQLLPHLTQEFREAAVGVMKAMCLDHLQFQHNLSFCQQSA